MLSYDIRELERQAARVEGDLAPDDPVWAEGDVRPAASVHATGRLSKAGSGQYYWSGRIAGVANGTCRRCLADVAVPVTEDVHVIFVEAGDEVAADPDAYRVSAHALTIDLRPAVREQWLLAAPAYALCREDCKGLCPRCGADLNAGPCACSPDTDHRWEALHSLRDASQPRHS